MSTIIVNTETQLVQSTLVAFSTLLVYDFLCTFDQELAYVWTSPSQWSAGTVLFILNRYLPFIDTFMALRLKLAVNSLETCMKQYRVVTWFIVCGIIISEVILLLRTYAIWEGKRAVLVILCISSVLTFTSAIIATHLEFKSIVYMMSTAPGCHIKSASSIVIIAYISLAISETTMAVLTAIKAYRDLRYSQSRWVIQLYREGLMFYLYLLLVSMANVLVPILAPRMYANFFSTPQRVLHSILSNRVLLLILKQKAAANMTNRASNGSVFASFDDSRLSTHMTIAEPGLEMMSVSYMVHPVGGGGGDGECASVSGGSGTGLDARSPKKLDLEIGVASDI
ncbi:hypothetical protein BJ912DRAFT_960577 [Pholiota molesta]|nr:hypothetical protein BJ912DRAFT_960577 [Pholiota molesta]